jgi:hypothetical protein
MILHVNTQTCVLYVIEKKRAYDQERSTKQKLSWFPSFLRFWRSLEQSYSWQLIAMAQTGDRNDRLKAVQLLAKLKSMKGKFKA